MKFSPEEMANFHTERTLNDAELIKGGAKFVPSDNPDQPRLEVTANQLDKAKLEHPTTSVAESITNALPNKEITQMAPEITIEGHLSKEHLQGYSEIPPEKLRQIWRENNLSSLFGKKVVSDLYDLSWKSNFIRQSTQPGSRYGIDLLYAKDIPKWWDMGYMVYQAVQDPELMSEVRESILQSLQEYVETFMRNNVFGNEFEKENREELVAVLEGFSRRPLTLDLKASKEHEETNITVKLWEGNHPPELLNQMLDIAKNKNQ